MSVQVHYSNSLSTIHESEALESLISSDDTSVTGRDVDSQKQTSQKRLLACPPNKSFFTFFPGRSYMDNQVNYFCQHLFVPNLASTSMFAYFYSHLLWTYISGSNQIKFPPSYTRGESWNWTQVLLLRERPLWPLDYGSTSYVTLSRVYTRYRPRLQYSNTGYMCQRYTRDN